MAGKYRTRHQRARTLPYPTMTVEQIMALPVGDLAAPDCHLWLWTTDAFLHRAFHVFDAWGFKYLAPVTWVKSSGCGNYWVHRTQTLLMGYRTKCLFPQARYLPNFFTAPNPQHHSEKPLASYELIESVSPGPRLELFARRRHNDTWSVWGNEVDCDIMLGAGPGG